MIRSVLLFVALFSVGAVGALLTRAALHRPHDEASPAVERPEGVGQVGNALVPAAPTPPPQATQPAAPSPEAHAAHGSHMPASAAEGVKADVPVNTVCAICGMPVDPKLPTAEYQGKTIGFGCRMCPPKFKADPDRYGPYYLRNETLKR